MIALDTTVLVEAEVADSAGHDAALAFLRKHLADSKGRAFALAPQVLTEFIHVVSDPKRFVRPLSVPEAVKRAEYWWSAREVGRITAGPEATALFLKWMSAHNLGRKRVLDTYLAATYSAAGIRRLASSNGRDFSVFGVFELLLP